MDLNVFILSQRNYEGMVSCTSTTDDTDPAHVADTSHATATSQDKWAEGVLLYLEVHPIDLLRTFGIGMLGGLLRRKLGW